MTGETDLDDVIKNTSDPKAAITLIVIALKTVRGLVSATKESFDEKFEVVQLSVSQMREIVDALKLDSSKEHGKSDTNKLWVAGLVALATGLIVAGAAHFWK